MDSAEEIKQLITTINELVESEGAGEQTDDFWLDAGSRILIFIDSIVQKPEKVNAMTPREYSKDNTCIIETIFIILAKIPHHLNEPFDNKIWTHRHTTISEQTDSEEYSIREVNSISFYELAISRCCSWICQLLGDRFNYIQRLLIKNIFGTSEVCSLFASDTYIFLLRLVHPNHKMSMCQLIMNMCKIAPPDALTKGAALINRIKDPIVNFENSTYQYLLDFS